MKRWRYTLLLIMFPLFAAARDGHRQRIRAMTGLLRTTGCREGFILRYFGEEPSERCGHCDNCSRERHVPGDSGDLRQQLLAVLATPAPFHKVLSAFPQAEQDRIVAIIRELMDRNQIVRKDELLHLNKLPTN